MSRPRSGIAAELVPLILVLSCLAGSLALIVLVHRRVASRRPSKPPLAMAISPAPPLPAAPKPVPLPIPAPIPPETEPDVPEPPPPPTPEDPTPKAVARLTSAEAEQLLEASRADRRAAALEQARKAALAESERWRRRESLVRLQLDSLDSKARKLEHEVDELALERDALEKERDVRKALASQDRPSPGQAILPHRGVNGTWRRPIVVECGNGMATLQPQGVGFGLLEMASGFGPAANPFVAMVAGEAIRIQGNVSPDGKAVVPYIFFLVRPDGIRAYYEARGRLEPLGITFGYELADQDWEVDFPDLDDVKSWDGSAPSRPSTTDTLASNPRKPAGGSPAEDEDFPPWATSRSKGRAGRGWTPGGESLWPPQARTSGGGGGGGGGGGHVSLNDAAAPGTGTSPDGDRSNLPIGASPGIPDGVDPLAGLPGISAGRPRPGPGIPPDSVVPGERATSGRTVQLPGSTPPTTSGPRGHAADRAGGSRLPPSHQHSMSRPLEPAVDDASTASRAMPRGATEDDPASSFVWPGQAKGEPRSRPSDRQAQPSGEEQSSGDHGSPDLAPPVLHSGPFTRPLAMGLDSPTSPDGPASAGDPFDQDPTQSDGSPLAGSDVAGVGRAPRSSQASSPGDLSGNPGSSGTMSNGRPIGTSDASGSPPPSGSPPLATFGLGEMPSAADPSATDSPPTTPSRKMPSRPFSPSDPGSSTFEVVVVCGKHGVIVQPGGYRVTVDALKDRDGLLKKQMVALVKARRAAVPKVVIDPGIRFLVQPGGDKTFWAARSQFLLSGLNWPMTTQVADPDRVSIIPSESW